MINPTNVFENPSSPARSETADPCTPIPAPIRNTEINIATIVVRELGEAGGTVTVPSLGVISAILHNVVTEGARVRV